MNAIVPYLLYEDAEAAIAFLERAFGFREVDRTTTPEGRIMNCALAGPTGGEVWLGEVDRVEGHSIVYVYVEDGAVIGTDPADQVYGDRRYDALDPQGHAWFFAHPISEDSPAGRS